MLIHGVFLECWLLVYVLCDFHVSLKISHPACPCDHYFEKVDPPIECWFITPQAGVSTEESCVESVISTPASTTVENGDDGLVKRDAYLISDRVSCSSVTCAIKSGFVCGWCVYKQYRVPLATDRLT